MYLCPPTKTEFKVYKFDSNNVVSHGFIMTDLWKGEVAMAGQLRKVDTRDLFLL